MSGVEPAGTMAALGGELLETFLALMPDAAVAVDGRGRIVAVNDAATALFAYRPGELVGLEVERLVPERFATRHRADRAAYAERPHARAMAAGQDLAGRRADGSEVPVDISLAPIDAGGRPLVVAAVRDATERRAATAAQAELAAIVESSLDGIVAIRTDGTVTSWNAGAARLLGHAAVDVIGRRIQALIPDDAAADFDALLTRSGRGDAAVADTEWSTADGARLPIALSISPLVEGDGRQVGWSVVLRDITERKQAERAAWQLLEELRRQERWQAANAEIRGAILSGATAEGIAQLVCERACDLFEATAALVVRTGQQVEVLAAAGTAADLRGTTVASEAGLGELAARTGEPALVAHSQVVGLEDLALLVVGSSLEQFGNATLVADGLITSAAITVQLVEARASAERLLLSEDRERIARDLHDLVIQRLFATGMSLQSTLVSVRDERTSQRISSAVESLDLTIAQIRTAIFELHAVHRGDDKLRSDLVAVARRAGEQLGHQPVVRFEGPVDTMVPIEVAAHVVAVANEALSNVVRHARARSVEVSLAVEDHHLTLLVRDDGIGIPEHARRSGLANMERRAADLGGDLDVRSASDDGTAITWRVPLGRS